MTIDLFTSCRFQSTTWGFRARKNSL